MSRAALLLGDGRRDEFTWEQGLARVCGAGSVGRSGTGGGRRRAVSGGLARWAARPCGARAGRRRVPRVEGKGGAEQARARVGGSERSGRRRARSWPCAAERKGERKEREGRRKEKGKEKEKMKKRGKGKKKMGRERESECTGADRGGRSRVGDKPQSGAGRDGDKEKGEGYGR